MPDERFFPPSNFGASSPVILSGKHALSQVEGAGVSRPESEESFGSS
jgi:hypothetical protein